MKKSLTTGLKLMMLALLCLGLALPAPARADEGHTEWAQEAAQRLLEQIEALAADQYYVAAIAGSPDARELVESWQREMLQRDPVVHAYDPPGMEDLMKSEGQLEQLSLMLRMSEAARRSIQRGMPSMLANLVNQPAGLPAMLASNALTVSSCMARPADFRPLWLAYAYDSLAVLVCFEENECGVSVLAIPMDSAVVERLDSWGK